MNMDCGYSPELDFYIEKIDRNNAYEMATFHTHHKYEIYYEIEGTRRYFIEDAAYVVNAGSVVLIGENQIHKTSTIGDGPSSRIAIIFRPEYLQEICNSFADVDFFDFLGKRGNHLLNSISVKQQNRIFAMMQQMMSLQSEEGQDVKAANKMMLATLLLYLKHLCQMQRERGGDSGRVSNRIIDQIQSYISLHYAEKLTLTGIAEKILYQSLLSESIVQENNQFELGGIHQRDSDQGGTEPDRKDGRQHRGCGREDGLYDNGTFSPRIQRCHRVFAPAISAVLPQDQQERGIIV